ncbi:MAG: hypothetical protein AAB900_00465, partial [Patescibacteria group bacterium]
MSTTIKKETLTKGHLFSLLGDTFEVFGYEGKQVRCLLHADDLAAAVVMGIDHREPFHGDVFNVSGGRGND